MNKSIHKTKHSAPSKNLNIFSQVNIDGLSRHSKLALDKFTFNNNISLLALQETKLNQNQLDKLDKFDNLESFFLPKSDSTYGVGMLISPLLVPQRVTELEDQLCDIVWCMIRLNNTCVLVASAYTPPNNVLRLRNLLANIEQAHSYAMKNKIKDILVFGDYNSRNMLWGDTKNNTHGHKLIEFIDGSSFMLCSPADKTFVSPNNGGSVIDLLLGSGKITNNISENWTDRSSELFTGAPVRGHFPVLYTVGQCSLVTETKQYDDYCNTNWAHWKDNLESSLSSMTTPAVYENKPELLHHMVNCLNSAMQIANKSIPQKIVSRHSKPFWTESLTICSKELEELTISIRCRSTPLNNKLFKEKKEEFKSLLIKEKNEWIREKLSNINIADSRLFWKRYRVLFHGRQANFIGNLSKNGILHTSQKDKENVLFDEFFSGAHLRESNFDNEFAEQINDVYVSLKDSKMAQIPSLVNNVQETLSSVDKTLKHVASAVNNIDATLNSKITSLELEDIIKGLKTDGKSTDCYNINPIMLKHLGPSTKDLILNIFNLCLDTGYWSWGKQEIYVLSRNLASLATWIQVLTVQSVFLVTSGNS